VELNPVRAGLADAPDDWPWSSARAHLSGEPDPLTDNVQEMADYIGDWHRYLALDVEETERLRFRKHSRTGRPLGGEAFLHRLEERLGRIVAKRKPGPKGPRKKN
jgi:putative transposase